MDDGGGRMVAEIIGRVGVLEGRLGALEDRMGRTETMVSAALERVARSVENLGAEHRATHSGLKSQIDKIESKLDREEGARAQIAHDRDASDKAKAEAQEVFFTRENIRLARWMLVATAIGVLGGLLGQVHFHILDLPTH